MNSSSNGRLSSRRGSHPVGTSAAPAPAFSVINGKVPISVNSSSSTTTASSSLQQAPSIFGRQQGWSDHVADAKMLKPFSATPASISANSSVVAAASTTAATTTSTVIHQSSASVGVVTVNPVQHESVKFVNSTMEILENQIKREEAPKKKRTRTSTEQLKILQKAFATDPMPSSAARLALSKRLGMNPRAVQVWFQNRRAKEKLDARRAEMGLSAGTSFTDSHSHGDATDFESSVGSATTGVNVDIDDLSAAVDDESVDVSGGNLFNSLRATGMMRRFPSSATTTSSSVKTQRSASTPNGFLFSTTGSSFGSSALPFHQQQQQQQQQSTFFPATSSFLADVNEASVDDLYCDLGTGSAASPTEVPLEFYGGLVVDRSPSVSPIGFGTGRSHLFTSPFGMENDLLMSSVFPLGGMSSSSGCNPATGNSLLNSLNSTANANATTSSANNANTTTATANTAIAANSLRNPQAANNVFLTSSFSHFPAVSSAAHSATRRSYSLPEAHISLSPAQLQSLEAFSVQMFPSPLLSSIDETPMAELLDLPLNNVSGSAAAAGGGGGGGGSCEKRVFNEFLENEVIR